MATNNSIFDNGFHCGGSRGGGAVKGVLTHFPSKICIYISLLDTANKIIVGYHLRITVHRPPDGMKAFASGDVC